jgi:Ser/Thr protein kinase RdoA (MazF antagonist)
VADSDGGDDHRLGGLLCAGRLTLQPGRVKPREGRAWLVEWHGTLGVLRSLPARPEGMAVATNDVEWMHGYLSRLASTDFPAPRPLPCFRGLSWTVEAGELWEIVSYLPGRAVGWDPAPSMEKVGAFLGGYHSAARQVDVTSQRPTALPLAAVPEILLSHTLETVAPGRAAAIRQLACDLAHDLDGAAEPEADKIVIHGDFTNDNVIASGTPPAPAGLIDFALAHVEVPVADVGYGLWRSGRPHEQADHIDLHRLRRFVHGYASTARISPDQAAVIPLYLRGRGLQMIAKRIRAGRNETGMLAQVQWLGANARALSDAAAGAVS